MRRRAHGTWLRVFRNTLSPLRLEPCALCLIDTGQVDF